MKLFAVGDDVTLGFIRDQEDQDEFFLVIKSVKTKETLKIVVDDIDEIEHVDGSLKFFIHYQKRVGQSNSVMGGGNASGPGGRNQSIKNLFKKKITKQGAKQKTGSQAAENDEDIL